MEVLAEFNYFSFVSILISFYSMRAVFSLKRENNKQKPCFARKFVLHSGCLMQIVQSLWEMKRASHCGRPGSQSKANKSKSDQIQLSPLSLRVLTRIASAELNLEKNNLFRRFHSWATRNFIRWCLEMLFIRVIGGFLFFGFIFLKKNKNRRKERNFF